MTTFVNPTCATAHNLIFFVFFPTQKQDHGIKPRGVKVKEKEIHGSDRLIGGFEKATQMKKRPRMTQRHLVLQWKQILVVHLVLRRQHEREKDQQ